MFACILMNGKEFTSAASVINLSDTVDEAIKKSDLLLKRHRIFTIVLEI